MASASERIALIINPAAGRRTGGPAGRDVAAWVRERARDLGMCVDMVVRHTEGPGSAEKLARECADAEADVIAACGGDGTLGEVVNGVAGRRVVVGVIPLGTGNDFARCIGVGTDPRAAVDAVLGGRTRLVDVGICRERRFVNVAGCGFDAEVAHRVNTTYRRLGGTPAYVGAVLHSLLRYRAARFSITVDGSTTEVEAMLCSVANAQTYGGGMRIAPDAELDDGLFDVVILRKAGRVEFLRSFPGVFAGTHASHPKVSIIRGKHVEVDADRPMPVLIDGEVIGTTPVDFRLLPGELEIRVP